MLHLGVHWLLVGVGFFRTGWTLNYAIDRKGWHIVVTDSELSLSWNASGAVWRSPLLTAAPAERSASVRNGCWSLTAKPATTRGRSKIEVAKWIRGRPYVHEKKIHWAPGHLYVNGHIVIPPMQKGDSFTEPWEMTLTPNGTGKISFSIKVGSEKGVGMPGIARRWPFRRNLSIPKEEYEYDSLELSLLWFLEAGERIVGAGEQYSTVDLRGQQFELWSGEQGIGRGRLPITRTMNTVAWPCGGSKYTTYSAVPALLSTRGYGIVLENTQLVSVDLRSDTAEMAVSFEDRMSSSLELAGHVLGGSGVRDLLAPLTTVTGRMDPPPDWASGGFVIGTSGGYKAVNDNINTLLTAGVPVVGVWIQDWSGMVSSANGQFVWWNWVLDESRYPKSWFRDLNAKGIKVMTYINPFLSTANGSDGKPPEVFLEAQRLGHLITDRTGEPLVEKVAFADFTYGTVNVLKEESRKWWAKIMRCNVMMACNGSEPLVHGWMNDYGEYLPLSAHVSTNESGEELASDMHNSYGRFHAAAAREASEGFPNVTFFSRSGDLHSPGTARMFWLGDQLANYDGCDGMQSAVIGAMSGGLSGWTINHADVGAFTIINRVPWLPLPGIHFNRSPTQMIRWLEVCVFLNALYRSHMGLVPDAAAQPWDSDIVSHTSLLSRLFRDLTPYRDFLFGQAQKSGLPLVRHGLLVYPDDPSWFNASADYTKDCAAGNEIGLSQFFFGDEVLVAPVYNDFDKVHVYLPKGSWVHFWTSQRVEGPSYTLWSSPLGKPAFFYRASTSAEPNSWALFFQKLSKKYSTSGVRATSGEADEVLV